MRCFPTPIRNLELRDRLSELLKDALRKDYRAAPLYLLRTFDRMTGAHAQAEVSRNALVKAAERSFSEIGVEMTAAEALDELLATRLLRVLAHEESEPARLAPGETLHAELSAAADRIEAYCRALQGLPRQALRSVPPVARALEEAACLFNEGLFFEVHEILEAVWLTEAGGARLLLQGLIQIAVGFHHLENNNLRGALALLREGVEKVRGYNPDRVGPEPDRFLASVDRARQLIESLGEAAFDRFDRRRIPQMPPMRNMLSGVRPTG